uniref:Protein kinase domain-containing protein n=1 Tax=viral metagenome TaxID=1070528 RepID=A0A6C0I4T7_9ZZZZ
MSSKFNLHYSKPSLLDVQALANKYDPSEEDKEYEYNPFSITSLQQYNPIYSLFFDMTEKNCDKIGLNHSFHIVNMNQVLNSSTKEVVDKPVFIKYSPLLDPIRYMIGKYKKEGDDALRTLPMPFSTAKSASKLLHVNNASYTDNFFCYLSGQLNLHHGFSHGLEFYGSFLGIQEKYKMNITDDLEYLIDSKYFSDHCNKLFSITKSENARIGATTSSRGNKLKLDITNDKDDIVTIDAEELDDDGFSAEGELTDLSELVYEGAEEEEEDSGSDSATEEEEDEDSATEEEEDEDEEEDEEEAEEDEGWATDEESEGAEEAEEYAYIRNFPVQLICLEKCEGTLDRLFLKKEISYEMSASILMQVIMTLLTFQKCFHFTHNDLHTNNIMYQSTTIEYMHYRVNGKVYRVPTYGKIFKMIDFGRSIYQFQGKKFCSDSFADNGDAATQYNCEPFMNEKKPRIDPNYSFDLCRLGCSMYDFIIESEDEESMDDFQKTVYRWCLDDNGKNVLYKRNGDDRYPNFKLYKMIARTVHNHTPEQQLEFPYFSQFLFEGTVETDATVIDIDGLPTYY